MSLITPYTSAYGNIAQTNLSTALNATKQEELVTDVTQKAFKDYQNNKFGIGHHVKKFVVSVAGGGVVIGAPVAGVLGGTYWLLQDYIREPSLLIKNPPLPTLRGALSVGGAVAVDAFFYKTFGFTPIKTSIAWSIGMVSMGIVNAANFAQNMIAGTFLQKEKEMIKTREEMYKLMVSDLKTTYDDMADGLSQLLHASIDTPKELLKLRTFGNEIQDQLPFIQKQLEKYELKTADVSSILSKFSSVGAYAQKFALDLRVPKTENDNRFNVELMSVLSEEEFASKAVSMEVKGHVKSAKTHSLGITHTLKSLGKAGLKGSAVALATGLVLPTIFAVGAYVSNNSSCLVNRTFEACALEKTATLASIPVAVIAAGVKVKQVLSSCFAERRKSDQKKLENTKLACEKMNSIYDGMADCLAGEMISGVSFELKQKANRISEKLPAIKKEIAKSGVQNPQRITQQLENVLNSILSTRKY